MDLKTYARKRDFSRTPEPAASDPPETSGDLFVVQKHDATRLHYDLRLELDGVLKSWAVPKGPSPDPQDKRLAVAVEDHPLAYGSFEGIIPDGEYGGGTVMLWDHGSWKPDGDPRQGLRKGKLSFELHGEKLHGHWALVRMKGDRSDDGKNWLLIKEKDETTLADGDAFLEQHAKSALSGRTIEQIARASDTVWQDDGAVPTGAPAHDPSALTNVRRGAPPDSLKPQLATLIDQVPDGEEWLHEIKLDGYRLLAYLEDDGTVRMLTRNGHNWSDKFAPLVEGLEALGLEPCILDGEAVMLRADGSTDFQALQKALKHGGSAGLVYYVFDVLHYGGYDLRKVPQIERKEFLRELLGSKGEAGVIRYLDHLEGQGKAFYQTACEHHLEGIICKAREGVYLSKRSRSWLKVKCLQRQEFVIGGYTDPDGSRIGFGALLVGVYGDDGKLHYCGGVGTGFSDQLLAELTDTLQGITRQTMPFVELPAAVKRKAHWVTPKLICEVEFTEWTGDDRLRHPSFKGLRTDKEPQAIVRERPAAMAQLTESSSPAEQPTMSSKRNLPAYAGVTISSPDRVIYPDMQLTKQDLAAYYEEIGDWILPGLVKRPLSVVRCPSGQSGSCFYQRHLGETIPDPVRAVEIPGSDEQHEYMMIDNLAGLLTLVQFGALELHPWGCSVDQPDKPDQLIFDLDPGEDVPWETVVQGAHELRGMLDVLGLQAFARLSGGKGVHVVVPLTRRHGWNEVKTFSGAVAAFMERGHPDRYTANMSKHKRRGRIYVDYLRNGKSATAIASYSTRARPVAPVALPVRWDELSAVTAADAYDVRAVRQRLRALKSDPWAAFATVRQSITNHMKEAVGLAD